MRNFLFTCLAMLLMTGVAVAGWNIKQRDDGTAEWQDGDGGTYRLGQQILSVNLENLGTASTTYVSVPYAGRIFQVDLAVHGDVKTTTEMVTVSIMSATSNGNFIDITFNNNIEVASANQRSSDQFYLLGGPGARYSSGPMTGKAVDGSTAAEAEAGVPPSVPEGGTIGIATGGASGADVDATILSYYIPK